MLKQEEEDKDSNMIPLKSSYWQWSHRFFTTRSQLCRIYVYSWLYREENKKTIE